MGLNITDLSRKLVHILWRGRCGGGANSAIQQVLEKLHSTYPK